MERKRLFLAMEVVAPWPEDLPPGRLLEEPHRHLTLAFLGEMHLPTVLAALADAFPIPPFRIGLAALFDYPLFLPDKHPRVIAWHVEWLEKKELFLTYQRQIIAWLREQKLLTREKSDETFVCGYPLIPHVTLARTPFTAHLWRERFVPLPLFTRDLQLYESKGHSRYEICWNYPILPPYEVIEHTADMAFLVRGQNYSELYLHAFLALSFYYPPLLQYFSEKKPTDLAAVVSALNHDVAVVDTHIGSPFKAVSLHGKYSENTWEMIVDV